MNFMNSLGNGITLIVAVPFIIIALFLLVRGLRGRRVATASRSWPTITGQILSSAVEARTSTDSNGSHHTSYYPVILYEYTINGQLYRNNTLSVEGASGGSASWAQQKVIEYTPGRNVQLHYNPHNPQQAGLEYSSSSSTILIAIAVFMLVFILCIVLFMSSIMGMVSSLISGIPK